MISEYKITSQEHMVNLAEKAYDKAMAAVNKFTDPDDPNLIEPLMVMTTMMNVWREQSELLEKMKDEWLVQSAEKS